MNVVTGEVMQEIDRRAMEEHGISGLTLMENAGRGCADLIMAGFGTTPGLHAVIVAGKGNNGGDGFVIARHLQNGGWRVATFVLAGREEITGDARSNLHRLHDATVIFCPEQGGLERYHTVFRDADLIVDALLGTGLKSEVGGKYAEAVEMINAAAKPVVAVDIPSGIDAGTGKVLGTAVRAAMTVTFALPKLGHVLYPGADHAGRLHVVDIGIPPELLEGVPAVEFLDAAAARSLIRPRDRSAHKGEFGHSFIVAGSRGKTGAAAMAANSAVRAGAGLVTLAVPESLNHILEVKTTEAMTLPLADEGMGCLPARVKTAVVKGAERKDALALGPGLSWNPETARLVRELVEELDLPTVVDADGLNALSDDLSVLTRKKSSSFILTPHPGEMARLTGMTAGEVEADRIGSARRFAAAHQVVLVLKGARTVIASPEGRVAINGSGNPGMASGGMGDVLTGILVALLGQGYDPFTAGKLGVFLHGFAGDIVAAEKGEIGMSAVDVQERIPSACKALLAGHPQPTGPMA